MKKVIKASQDTLVDLMAKTVDGEWVVIFEQIPESQAEAIWRAGFTTGDNRFSIQTEEGKRVMEYNRKVLGLNGTTQVKASSNSYELYDEFDEIYHDRFVDIELSVIDELGLYIDFSAIRFGDGPIWIFSDPEHENNSDMWDGDLDDALVQLDFQEYADGLVENVFCYPEEQWRSKYKNYLMSLIQ